MGRTIESNGTYQDVITTEVDCSSYCYGGRGGGVLEDKDAEFIALARTALPTLAKLARNLLEIRNNAQRQADDINGGDALDLTKLSTLTEVTRSINLAIYDALGDDDE